MTVMYQWADTVRTNQTIWQEVRLNFTHVTRLCLCPLSGGSVGLVGGWCCPDLRRQFILLRMDDRLRGIKTNPQASSSSLCRAEVEQTVVLCCDESGLRPAAVQVKSLTSFTGRAFGQLLIQFVLVFCRLYKCCSGTCLLLGLSLWEAV